MGRGRAESGDKSDKARDKAMRLLGVRSRSAQELIQRLTANGFQEDVSAAVVERLTRSGLVDDKRFAFERARAMGKGKGWGPRKLKSDLLHRGIPEDVVEEAILQAYGSLSCKQIMCKLVRKRFGGEVLTGKGDRKTRAKAQRYLLGKGFEPDEVYQVFSQT